ncbi:MAG: hypothetical protein GYB53_13020 [Rhodobacteraceae bacterium]|uniref:hypothetical protein n=1 Tax=Oceanicola sp. S124 TaxID=1042378 RepID=UPI000255826D|nr:hypothetical protein [Oceanicola sp. S124]MBR9764412.1 hypothetical protein [Paracoccaceae bacterium]MBR9819674.1 hypothetical protein [Paracoccaceae bacterium]
MAGKPEFTPTISFGNLVQIVLILLGGAGAFYAMRAQTETNASEIARSAVELKEARAEQNRLEARVRALENEQARADERFSSILGLLARIDARLERIESTPNGR